jgi:hypothetical protein
VVNSVFGISRHAFERAARPFAASTVFGATGMAYAFRKLATGIALSCLVLFPPVTALAETSLSVETTAYEWVEETPASQPATAHPALASFGPFAVITPDRVELNGTIETGTPKQFRAMLAAFPAISQIDMIDCPGTDDDEANFAVAHMIRERGITTNVPDGGSVRSGGVELFLAGTKRRAAPTAEFAVHSWRDEDGREADDYAATDPANQEYIAFYREVGMDTAKATAFYALTNSVGNDDALYLKARDIAAYIPLD